MAGVAGDRSHLGPRRFLLSFGRKFGANFQEQEESQTDHLMKLQILYFKIGVYTFFKRCSHIRHVSDIIGKFHLALLQVSARCQ